MSKVIVRCRSCGCKNFATIINLGSMYFTGIFPSEINQNVPQGELEMVRCLECGLAQLKHSFPMDELYGKNYGYESHLNNSMVKHLKDLAIQLESQQKLRDNDVVLDIASNDGTLVSGYKNPKLRFIGIDPLSEILENNYPKNSVKVANFFSDDAFFEVSSRKAKVITSCSVFYDLEEPLSFVNSISNVMSKDGIWVLEQSYYYSMIDTLSFDTICHEHLLYLTLTDISNLLKHTDLMIYDVSFNETNGGSFRVYISKKSASRVASQNVEMILRKENKRRDNWEKESVDFLQNVNLFKDQLLDIFSKHLSNLGCIHGVGASTKGNVLLQYCGIKNDVMSSIGEINPKKFGHFTPGSSIPIISEEELFETINSNCLLTVLPWHFFDNIKGNLNRKYSKQISYLRPLPIKPKLFI